LRVHFPEAMFGDALGEWWDMQFKSLAYYEPYPPPPTYAPSIKR